MYRAVIALLFASAVAYSQPAKVDPKLTFEVASIKPSPPETRGGGIRPSAGGDRYEATGCPLRLMIQVAYRVKADQVAGGPSWLDSESWDMMAKAEKPSSVEELHIMLQNLLADRFQLQFHRSTKEMPMYALTVDKGGSKMTPHQAASAGDPWIDNLQEKFLHMTLKATSAPMDFFAWRLSMLLDLPVVDQTNLKGGYDFNLSYTRDLPPGISEGAQLNGQPIDTTGPSIFEAIRQQLGLKLEKTRGPVETLAIDHVEKPSAN